MKTVHYTLVVRGDGTARLRSRNTRGLRLDKVAFPVKIKIADGWQSISADINIEMPPPPTVEA